MSIDMEPPLKKLKFNNVGIGNIINSYIDKIKTTENSLTAVLVDDIYKPIPLIAVFVGHIRDVKDISKTILILNNKMPLKDLQHLKRVKCQDVILCTKKSLGTFSIHDYIQNNVSELLNIFDGFKEIEVPSLPPKVKRQFEESNKIWSCNFHPNLYLEKLVNNIFFKADELKTHRQYIEIVFEITKWYTTREGIDINIENKMFDDINTTVVVDPILDRVIAVSFDNRLKHPIQHSVMLAIDNVAKTQNGGVWSIVQNDNISSGIDKELLPYLKENFPQIKFGQIQDTIQKINDKEGPYLCTGYYMYLLREPCFICAMALVHARVKRVFFCLDNPHDGALKSKTKLHAVPSLNHHFEVFTGFL